MLIVWIRIEGVWGWCAIIKGLKQGSRVKLTWQTTWSIR